MSLPSMTQGKAIAGIYSSDPSGGWGIGASSYQPVGTGPIGNFDYTTHRSSYFGWLQNVVVNATLVASQFPGAFAVSESDARHFLLNSNEINSAIGDIFDAVNNSYLPSDRSNLDRINGIRDTFNSYVNCANSFIKLTTDTEIDILKGLNFTLADTIYRPTGIIYGYQTVPAGHLKRLDSNDDYYRSPGSDIIYIGSTLSKPIKANGGDKFLFQNEGMTIIDGSGDNSYIFSGIGKYNTLEFYNYSSEYLIFVNVSNDISIIGKDGEYNVARNVDLLKFYDKVVQVTEGSIPNKLGTADKDILIGDRADNILSGLAGDDFLDGGSGNDVLRGGTGADILTGGLGNDLFYFTAGELTGGVVDTVMDGGISTNDLIRIDGAQYYQLAVTSISDGARIVFDGGNGFIDVKGVGTSPIVVATSTSVAGDFSQLSTASKADLQISYFDFANSQAWSKYTELNNGSGQLTRQFGSYDGSGGSWDFLYDVANTETTYATRFDYFNALGQKTQEVGTYDSPVSGNTKYIVTYDPGNTQPFTTSTTYYDALDRPTQVQAFYDAGGSGITTFDPDNTQPYAYYTTYYDALGRADQMNGVYDGTNGSYYVDFDQDNVQPWQSLTVLYDHAGTVTQQWYTMDNGAIVYI